MESLRQGAEKHKDRMVEPAHEPTPAPTPEPTPEPTPKPTRMAREYSEEELAAYKEGSEYLLRTGYLDPDYADLLLP